MDLFIDPTCDTAEAVLENAHDLRRAADDAERLILVRACQWADAHPAPEGEPGAFDDDRLPAMAWDASAEFALAIGLSDGSGTTLIHQALEARHRLPQVWARMLAGDLQGWRVRRIAETTLGQPDDVAADVDAHVAPIAHKVGIILLAKLLDEAMLRLHPEQREQEQLEELDRRRVNLSDEVSHNGVGHMSIDADLKDLVDFDEAVRDVAAELKELGSVESLDVRRAMAVGVLADPAAALALLHREDRPAPRRKRATLVLHLTQDALRGIQPVGRSERCGSTPMLEVAIRDWCGRTDTHLTVLPVVDANDHVAVPQYEVPDRLKVRVGVRDHHCVFPFCTRPAARCDHDHNVAHAAEGSTCSCNIAPLCRRHHRLKTHTAWKYTTIEPGCFLWTSPSGHTYFRDHTGSVDVTPQDKLSKHSGCFHEPPLTEDQSEPGAPSTDPLVAPSSAADPPLFDVSGAAAPSEDQTGLDPPCTRNQPGGAPPPVG